MLVLPYDTADRDAYEAAHAELLRRADRLVAVRNGEPPSGRGGGAVDTDLAAQAAVIPVDVVWPEWAGRASGCPGATGLSGFSDFFGLTQLFELVQLFGLT
ncbi:hypothetical protein ABZ918_09120 [Streptomyces viridosporus]|uniref:hypothetical protein n=1 Tax=Streptomyces viridosporus TaxID=67581 RepID=UPI00341A0146